MEFSAQTRSETSYTVFCLTNSTPCFLKNFLLCLKGDTLFSGLSRPFAETFPFSFNLFLTVAFANTIFPNINFFFGCVNISLIKISIVII